MMKRLAIGFVAMCTAHGGLAGCQAPQQNAPAVGEDASDEGPAADTAADTVTDEAAVSDATVAGASAAFGLDLYDAIAANDAGNVTLSPASISAAFALAYAGAREETAEEIASVLNFAADGEDFRDEMAAFQDLMNVDGEKLNIATANAAWFDEATVMEPDYLAAIASAYGADERRGDFRNSPDAARETINDWVEAQTHERIVDLLSEGEITDETRFALVNALYFDGDWAAPFDPNSTREDEFRTGGETLEVDMMRRTGDYRYLAGEGFAAVSLPYAGGDYSMAVFLPERDDGLGGFEERLSADALAGWLAELDGAAPREVDLKLPKYEARLSYRLKDALIAMGMPLAFSNQANFRGMVDPQKQPPGDERGVKIGHVVHQTFIKVDEKGTEAAAATAVVGVRATAAPMGPPPVAFHADHPFFYVMRHDETGAILFMGRVVNPGAA